MKKFIQYQVKISPKTFRKIIEEIIGKKIQDLVSENGEYFSEFEMKNTKFRAKLSHGRDEISFSYFGADLKSFTRFELVSIKIDGTRIVETFRLSGRFSRDSIIESLQMDFAKKLRERIVLEIRDIEV